MKDKLKVKIAADAAERRPEALTQAEKLMKYVACGFVISSVDEKGVLSLDYINDGYFAICETDRETLTDSYRADFLAGIHPEDRPLVENMLLSLTKTLEDQSVVYRFITPGGKQKWVSLKVRSVPDGKGGAVTYSTYSDVTDEYAASQRLRENERTLECAAGAAGLWCWKYDPALDRAYMDARSQRDFGLPPVIDDFLLKRTSREVVHPDSAEDYLRGFQRAIDSGEDVVFEIKYRQRNHSVHWARFHLNHIEDVEGGAPMIITTAIPIDVEMELKAKYQLEQRKPALGEGDLLAHALINLSTGETLEYAYRDGTPVPEIDRTALHYGGSNLDYLIIDEGERRRFRELNDARSLLERYSLGETEMGIDYRRRLPNGDIIWVRNLLHLVRDPSSGDVLLFDYYYDVEEEVMSGLLYRSIAGDNYESVTRVNGRSKKFYILNRGRSGPDAPPVTGDDFDAMTLRSIHEKVVPEDQEMAIRNSLVEGIKSNLSQRERFHFICREVERDGSVHYKKVTQYYLDRLRGVIACTQEDVTPLIQEEAKKSEQLERALDAANEASLAKSHFLSRMSHELRTPMNAIIGLSALAEGDVDDRAKMLDSVGKIGASAKYLLSLINDILEMSRIESGQMQLSEAPFDPAELLDAVNGIIKAQADERGLHYSCEASGFTELRYVGDVTKLEQILINLLGNSVKFTPSGGSVSLTAEKLYVVDGRAAVSFTVSDTGVGIDEEFLPHIFETFAQDPSESGVSAGGTGLGLAITKSMVELMNGDVSVISKKGEGSTFTIDLRLDVASGEPASQAPEPKRPAPDYSLQGKRVLLAEDHPLNVEVAKRLLEKYGAEVSVAWNGKEALDAFAASDPGFFSAILMDIRMPVMDGLAAARAIRALEREDSRLIPIIAMTANAFDEDEKRSYESGLNAHLIKPIVPHTMFATLKKLMDGGV